MPAVAIGTPVATGTVTHYNLPPARASPLLCAILLALHFSQPFASEFIKWAAAAFIVGGTLFPGSWTVFPRVASAWNVVRTACDIVFRVCFNFPHCLVIAMFVWRAFS